MNPEKLQKFYRLATNNSNKSEAAIAALKFVEALQASDLKIQLYKGEPPPTQEQIQEALKDYFKQGYEQGKKDIIDEINRQRIVNRPVSTAIGYGNISTTGNTIRFGNH